MPGLAASQQVTALAAMPLFWPFLILADLAPAVAACPLGGWLCARCSK